MEEKNIRTNNYSTCIYLFRYIPSVEENVSFSLLALTPLLWHCVKYPRGQSHFSQKMSTLQSIPSFDAKHMKKL